MSAGGHDALGGAPAHGKRVACPRIPFQPANPTTQINDKPATAVDGHRGAAVGAGDLFPEDVRYLAEVVVATTCDQICS